MRGLPSRLICLPALALGLLFVAPGCDSDPVPSAQDEVGSATTHLERGEDKPRADRGSVPGPALFGPKVVVANRAGGTISVIDARTDQVVDTITLPGAATPEPMYVVFSRATRRVLVGDRANDQVVAYDARNLSLIGTAPATGIFHMWADELRSQQLWVVDNVNNQLTVIDPAALTVLATVPIADGVPHDVVVDPRGRAAYTSVFVDGGPDLILKFDTGTFAEVARTEVGEDPHLSLPGLGQRLFVPNQGTDQVLVLDPSTLAVIEDLAVPGAHGAGANGAGSVFYTTNLPGGGTDGLFAIGTRALDVLGATDTPVAVPHNIAVSQSGRKLYVTHSGATADQVTVYSASAAAPVPVYETTVTVGLNPFGLAYVP